VQARLLLFLACLIAAVVVIGVRISTGGVFESNVLSLIPSSVNGASAQQASEHMRMKMEKRFTLLLSAEREEDARQAAEKLQKALIAVGLATDTAVYVEALRDFYYPFRYQLLDGNSRENLLKSSAQDLAGQVLKSLYGGPVEPRIYSLVDDPANLASAWFVSLQQSSVSMQPTSVPSFVENGRRWFVASGTLVNSPFDLQAQQQLQKFLSDLPSGTTVKRSGLVFHAMRGAHLAKKEISTVGAGSLLGILLLVLLAFQSLPAMFAMLALVGVSTLFALAASLLVFERLHLVTLAFGATLLGLVADYCFHFFCRWRSSGDAVLASRLVRKSLSLALVSTILAYTFQLLSPFPGLHQFAVFMISGLLSAGLIVIYILPLVLSRTRLPDSSEKRFIAKGVSLYSKIPQSSILKLAIILLLVLLLAFALRLSAEDDIRALNTSGEALLLEEEFIQTRLFDYETQRFLLLTEDDVQLALQQLEALSERSSVALRHIASVIPSLAQQKDDYNLIKEKLFSESGALTLVCQQAGLFCNTQIPPFRDLKPAHMPQELTDLLGVSALNNASLYIALPRSSEWSSQALQALDDGLFNYEDNIAALSQVLKELRQTVQLLLLLFLVLLGGLLWFLLRQRALAIILSLLAAVFVGIAGGVITGITLFHTLALLLVLGVSLDAAVFYARHGVNQDTLLAASLSAWTSLLAFGLLALSVVPLLAQFGRVVCWGLGAAWLLSPIMFSVFCDRGESNEGIH
jgi:predicted exporter